MTTDASFTPPQAPTDIYAMIDSFKRVPLDRARQLLAIANKGTADKLAYLAGTGSPYTTATDPAIIDGAFSGAVLAAFASLADAYEQEITAAAKLQTERDTYRDEVIDLRTGGPRA